MGADECVKKWEYEELLKRFTDFIRIHIHKYDLYKYGLDPEDIYQEVRIKLWRLLHSEKIIVNYPSYIKKMVNSSVIDQLRRIRREEGIFQHERQVIEQELSFSIEAARVKNIEEVVAKAVEMLIESRRQAVKLYLLNLSIQEISSYLHWSKDKTRNLLYRGLADLKNILKNMDIHYGSQR